VETDGVVPTLRDWDQVGAVVVADAARIRAKDANIRSLSARTKSSTFTVTDIGALSVIDARRTRTYQHGGRGNLSAANHAASRAK
jgi:hypothetical protein